jgi:hypothetical protein
MSSNLFSSILLTTTILLFVSKWPHTSGLPYPNGTQTTSSSILEDKTTTDEEQEGIGLPLRKWKKQAKLSRQQQKYNKGFDRKKKIPRQTISVEEKKILLDFYANRTSTSVRAGQGEDTAADAARPKANHVYDVIIVGAGWSGCSAGKDVIVFYFSFCFRSNGKGKPTLF